jgi:trimeric autotransporter adhesin
MNRSLAILLTGMAGLAASATADVRVIHASPDAPNVDIYVNGTPGTDDPAVRNLAFTQNTGYIPLPTGNYNFKVTPSGLPAPIVIDANAAIDGNTDYSIFATGFLADISPLVLVDDNTSLSNAARVRFVHLSPDAPSVDIFAAGVTDPIFGDVMFRENGGYITVAGGSYDLTVALANGGPAVLNLADVEFTNGFVYTIIAAGSVAAGTLQAVAYVDAIPTPGTAGLLAVAGLVATRRRRA